MESVQKLKEIRKRAQEAVADMPEGDLKIKAFELFMQHLLGADAPRLPEKHIKGESASMRPDKASRKAGTVKSRILLLKDEKFFDTPRTIAEVKAELDAHGWIHPTTALSGRLIALTQERQLRRIKDKGWKYVNP